MINTILAIKKTMSQTFNKTGARIPVTKVLAGPCVVTQVREVGKDGWHVQLGFGQRKLKNTSKSLQGHLKQVVKENFAPRYIKEVKFEGKPEFKVGDQIKVSDIFSQGDIVEVTGISKGKGFAGVVKRHHFKGGPKTHGQSDRERAPGSIGGTTTPGRVYKGKRMAGRMGSERKTVSNLSIVSVDPAKNEMDIKGPIPGRNNSLVIVRKIGQGKLSEDKPEEKSEDGKDASEIKE